MNGSADRFVRKKVAIVGSGCAGIGALWALNKTYHDVYMYEGADRLGGHTNTVMYKKGKYTTMVDTGFIVLNTATYREFIKPNGHAFSHRSQPTLSGFWIKSVSRPTLPR
jgi:predicted NAD/FAD-binding protein